MLDFTGFNKPQLEAIRHKDGNCVVMASPGSGKTRVITYRVAHLIEQGISPESILAITFSRKSANEMRDRISKITSSDVTMNTFHSVCYKILKVENPRFNDAQLIKDWQKKKFITDIVVKDLKLIKDEKKVKVNDVLRFISFNKNNFKLCTDKLIITDNMPFSMDVMKKIYTYYTAIMNRSKTIDFDDMLVECTDMLIKNDKIRKKYANRYKYILLDEFQDTCEVQMRLVELLAKENQNVFVVGDFLQSIYGFRASNINLILNFHKKWNAKVFVLDINYRSTPNIVDYCNLLVANSEEVKHEYYKKTKAHKPKEKDPEYNVYYDQNAEAYAIANKIKKLMDKNPQYTYKDFAILFRVNSQSRNFENSLFQAGIPYVIPESGSFYQRKEIQHMLNYMKLAVDTSNNEAYLSIYNSPSRYLGAKFISECQNRSETSGKSLYDSMFGMLGEWRYKTGIEDIEHIVSKIKRLIGKYNVGEIITNIREITDYDNFIGGEVTEDGDTNEKIENLESLVSQGKEYLDVNKFLADIDKLIAAKQGDKDSRNDKSKYVDAVQCLSIHKSKGLEFPVVFVVGVNSGVLPHWRCEEDTAEELRLMFVACSRPMNELYVSSTMYFNDKANTPSEFLENVYDVDFIEQKVQDCLDKQRKEIKEAIN